MSSRHIEAEVRDDVVMTVTGLHDLTRISISRLLNSVNLRRGRFCDWRNRLGQDIRTGSTVPTAHRLLEEEKKAIVDFYLDQPREGYRRCAYMMMDQGVAAASPSTVYRVLDEADVLRRWNRKKSAKGNGFEQPLQPHEHWHTDISYVRLSGIYYYLICVLDGYSRSIVHWDLRESMTDEDVGITHMAAIEKHPGIAPRFITDNGSQFTGKEFKKFIGDYGLSHARTSVAYPQSNGKIERFHGTIKSECIREKCLTDFEEAKRVIGEYVKYYNEERLHSAIGYVSPQDKLNGRAEIIIAERKRKLDTARRSRHLISHFSLQEQNQQSSIEGGDQAEACISAEACRQAGRAQREPKRSELCQAMA